MQRAFPGAVHVHLAQSTVALPFGPETTCVPPVLVLARVLELMHGEHRRTTLLVQPRTLHDVCHICQR